ncbi:hypothetical protein RJ641_003625 [Dillenia turbinata]|uniref:Uncharacterized protein n=1 Tax=Dillenia turbinata TaxID=194707 RepID=A0AAN8ZBL1_9MAGN
MCTFIHYDTAELEMLIVEMSFEQLASFTNYQAKLEASFESLGWDI